MVDSQGVTHHRVHQHGYVRLVEAWGSDEGIVAAARMSTDGAFRGWPEDERLLARLWRDRHTSPFEQAGLSLEVRAPLFVLREWQRHRTQCLAGDTMIACVSPSGTTYQRSIKSIFDLKHGGVQDTAPRKNGTSRSGAPVTRAPRFVDPWRTRVLPNCQSRTLRVLDEESLEFTTAQMADVWESGVKPVFIVTTHVGRTIKASAEHPFFTSRGWVKLKNLQPGDDIARMGKVTIAGPVVPPALRKGIGVWTSMMRNRLIRSVDECYLCGSQFEASHLDLDHVVPVVQNLLLALDERNLKPVCKQCHRNKTDAEQPSREGKTKRGVRWERVASIVPAGSEMTYDIEVEGPHHNYVANALVVHNSYNEQSARYSAIQPDDYSPTLERVLLGGQSTTNRQGSGEAVPYLAADHWLEELLELQAHAERVYRLGIESGVSRELARLALTVARYSRMRASANLRNWLAFLALRLAPDAQEEIRDYARAVAVIVAERFPRTWALAERDMA